MTANLKASVSDMLVATDASGKLTNLVREP